MMTTKTRACSASERQTGRSPLSQRVGLNRSRIRWTGPTPSRGAER